MTILQGSLLKHNIIHELGVTCISIACYTFSERISAHFNLINIPELMHAGPTQVLCTQHGA